MEEIHSVVWPQCPEEVKEKRNDFSFIGLSPTLPHQVFLKQKKIYCKMFL